MTTPTQGPPRYKRRLRNYLLDKSFQLKYAGFIFGVAAVLSVVWGRSCGRRARAWWA